MASKKAPAKASPKKKMSQKGESTQKHTELSVLPRRRPSKKPKAEKKSAEQRYLSRKSKRDIWAAQHPDMTPGTIGQASAPKPVIMAVDVTDQIGDRIASDAQVVEAVVAAPFEADQKAIDESGDPAPTVA